MDLLLYCTDESMIPVDLSANCEGRIYDPNGSGIQILGIRSRDPFSGSTDMSGDESPVRAPVRAPHFAPTCNGVRVCGRNRTEAREREWAEGTVSSLPGTLNFRIKNCHSTGIARSGGGVRANTTSYA